MIVAELARKPHDADVDRMSASMVNELYRGVESEYEICIHDDRLRIFIW